MLENTFTLASRHTLNERTIWLCAPDARPQVDHLAVFLDGELYRDRMGTVALLDELRQQDRIGRTLAVFVSYQSEEARWRECPCYPPFAQFIATELLPWLERARPEIQPVKSRTLIGLSYTGLAAAYVALQSPASFTKVIAQSGSFWSDDCWLTKQYERLKSRLPVDFYLDVGTREIQENVRHKEDVLQVVSQITSVRRFRDAIHATGHGVRYREFEGGHDFACWKETLPDALTWALPP